MIGRGGERTLGTVLRNANGRKAFNKTQPPGPYNCPGLRKLRGVAH
jgi:hypothetical protein